MNKRSGRNRKIKKIGLIVLAPVLSLSVAITAIASNSDSPLWRIPFSNQGESELNNSSYLSSITMQSFALADMENMDEVIAAEEASKATSTAQSMECADPDKAGSLANAQQQAMEDARTLDTATINLDDIFNITKKGGCFNALSEFPDLSVMIPSITSILNSLKDTLLNYATRKVCSATNEALEQALDPLKGALDGISERGSIDLNGQVNAQVSKRLYDLDPELGRVSRPAKPAETIDFKW